MFGKRCCWLALHRSAVDLKRNHCSAALIRDYFQEIGKRKADAQHGCYERVLLYWEACPCVMVRVDWQVNIILAHAPVGRLFWKGADRDLYWPLSQRSIAALMAAFSMPLIAGMMLLVGIQLARLRENYEGGSWRCVGYCGAFRRHEHWHQFSGWRLVCAKRCYF